jgi:hypothetical protein
VVCKDYYRNTGLSPDNRSGACWITANGIWTRDQLYGATQLTWPDISIAFELIELGGFLGLLFLCLLFTDSN